MTTTPFTPLPHGMENETQAAAYFTPTTTKYRALLPSTATGTITTGCPRSIQLQNGLMNGRLVMQSFMHTSTLHHAQPILLAQVVVQVTAVPLRVERGCP